MDAVYDELRAGAERMMALQVAPGRPGATLQPTALVHEAFLRLIMEGLSYERRGNFFAAFNRRTMEVLYGYIRRRKAKKRGGDWARVALNPDAGVPDPSAPGQIDEAADVLAQVEALEKLAEFDSRKADVVKLRMFCGLTVAEVADALGIAKATVDRDRIFTKAWLGNELGE